MQASQLAVAAPALQRLPKVWQFFVIAFCVVALSKVAAAQGNSGTRPSSSLAQIRGKDGKLQDFAALMRTLVKNPPDDCSAPANPSATRTGLTAEQSLFALLSGAVLRYLKQTPDDPSKAVTKALAPFQTLSAQVATSWPRESLLRTEASSDGPLLILKIAVWNQSTFVSYARDDSTAGRDAWEIIKSGTDWKEEAPSESVESFSLLPTPSGNPRFLVVKHYSDCMAGMSHDYVVEAYEWIKGDHRIERILQRISELPSTAPNWKLHTSGKLIQIPYCWSGALQFASAYAPICSLESYDISGETIRHVATQNDPEDLALVEKILAGVKAHDLATVERYCSSDRIAREIMAAVPTKPFFSEYSSRNLDNGKELLELDDQIEIQFVIERTSKRWTVTHFQVSDN